MSEDSRKYIFEVKRLAGSGVTNTDIAKYLQITKEELLIEYSDVIAKAVLDKTSLVASALYDLAVGGNLQAQVFWLKNIGKWEQYAEQKDETITKAEIITEIDIKIGTTKDDFEVTDET